MTINLLPEQEKKEIKKQKYLKKIFIILIFILISILFLLLIIFGLKLYLDSKIEVSQKVISLKEREFREYSFQNFQNIVKQGNEDFFKIQSFWKNQFLITPIFEELDSLVPDTIYFTNLSLQKISQEVQKEKTQKDKIKTFFQVNISGWADNREDLFYFKKALEGREMFEQIYFSLFSWVKPTNIIFSLSFIVPKTDDVN